MSNKNPYLDRKVVKVFTDGKKSMYVALLEGDIIVKKYDGNIKKQKDCYTIEIAVLKRLKGCDFTTQLLYHDDENFILYETYCGGDKVNRSSKNLQNEVRKLMRRLSDEYGVKRYEDGIQVYYLPGLVNIARKDDRTFIFDFGSKYWKVADKCDECEHYH